jgi:hypothetical protein
LNNDTTEYEETSLTFTTLPTTQYLVFFNYNGSVEYPNRKTLNDVMGSVMLNLGSTALPYEPYGYKLPVTCNGETKNIYIGNYPLNKSGNVADDVQYSTQMLTRRIDPETLAVLATPTTELIAVPQLPTTAGTNTLTVGTTVQPSEVSITGNIKEVST